MDREFRGVVEFHGHLCMDIALGYRVAKAALRELSCQRPSDEELVALVENDSCSVDAVQAVTGCTFGKGNLVYKPNGKAAYTFYDRRSGRAVRIYCHFWKRFDQGEGVDFMNRMNQVLSGQASAAEGERFQRSMEELSNRILNLQEGELFAITHLKEEAPPGARIFRSSECGGCGEWTMETRLTQRNGMLLCPPCLQQR